MLILIIAEAALETIPKELWSYHSIRKHALLKGKKAGEILLDRGYHHSAMIKLDNAEKRGRPDLIHISLLEATSTPLYIEGRLEIYVHTITDKVIRVGQLVRLPRAYYRFEGLMEKLFVKGKINSKGSNLLELSDLSFKQLISKIRPTITIGLSTIGEKNTFEEVAKELAKYVKPALVVGGFPRGHFSKAVTSSLNALYSIHELALQAHVVIARMIYEYEKAIYK